MSVFSVRQGRDIKLKGPAVKKIEASGLPAKVAIQPADFRGFRPRLLVKVDDMVKVGTPLLEDKDHLAVKIVSPVSGKVIALNRGEKRILLEIVIQTDGKQEKLFLKTFSPEEIQKLSRHDIIQHLLAGGVWPCIRQRPFSKIAHPEHPPKSIFIQAMNTEPLAPDVDFILTGQEKDFQRGLDILKRLTDGDVHICCGVNPASKALLESKNVAIHQFSGPHPSGNVSTHIHYIDPIKKGDVIWYLGAEDVLRVAALFDKGSFSPERVVAVTGEGVQERVYRKTIIGAAVNHLLKGAALQGMRVISGGVLAGKAVAAQGFLSFYDSQITVIPEGGKREFLGWMMPGFNKFSFSQTFPSLRSPDQEVSLNTDKNGSDRAIVFNDVYDKYVALDIMTFFLYRAVLAGDIEEAERLGILECDEEDFALCTFACPSKVDIGAVIRQGLEKIEKEG